MTTLVSARCHCARNKFKIPFDASSLPRSAIMCHCNTCRHSTGSMGYCNVRIDGPQVPLSIESTNETHIPADLSNLAEYRASATAVRYFCRTCSAHMFFRWQAGGEDRWGVMTGCLERIDGIVALVQHEFVGDTLDGGLADHIPSYGNKFLKRYRDGDPETSEELPLGWNVGGGLNPKTLPLHCHCKAVQLYITRPTKKLQESQKDIWVVPGKEPTDPMRFMATHCLCNDCRLASGHEITTWLVVSDENIIDAASSAPVNLQDLEKRPKGLKQYASSEGHHRESCRTCGASVFWWRHMGEGETPHTDVAAGLIDQEAPGGARAESWFDWEIREPGFAEYALSKETAKALKDGWKAYVDSRVK